MFDLTLEDGLTLHRTTWWPDFRSITQSLVEEMIDLGLTTPQEFDDWQEQKLEGEQLADFEQRLVLMTFKVSRQTPRQ